MIRARIKVSGDYDHCVPRIRGSVARVRGQWWDWGVSIVTELSVAPGQRAVARLRGQ